MCLRYRDVEAGWYREGKGQKRLDCWHLSLCKLSGSARKRHKNSQRGMRLLAGGLSFCKLSGLAQEKAVSVVVQCCLLAPCFVQPRTSEQETAENSLFGIVLLAGDLLHAVCEFSIRKSDKESARDRCDCPHFPFCKLSTSALERESARDRSDCLDIPLCRL